MRGVVSATVTLQLALALRSTTSITMADLVAIDNQRDASLLSPSAPVEPAMNEQTVLNDKLTTADKTDELIDNQLTHENTDDSEEDDTEEDGEDPIRQSNVDRRLTWIGEGLLNGEGLDAVEQLMNLPSVPSPLSDASTNANEPTVRVERSGSKLLDFLAKEEGYVPNQTPTVANVCAPPPPTKEATSPTKEAKRANKLLDFLATEVGERYLDDVYADEDREDEQEQPEQTPTTSSSSTPTPTDSGHPNNKLLAFLAKERGERLHDVEKINTAPRPEPYGVTLRFETADADKADKPTPTTTSSPEPRLTETKLIEPSAERNRLAEFVKNVQPPSRPKFVIFNPDDLVSSSSSSSEGEGDDESSPSTGHIKELKLKKRSTQGRVRFANQGLDIQSGVVRQGIVDHYGREELLDFVVQVDEKSLPHSAVPVLESPVEHTPPPPLRHESPTPTRRESPPPPQPVVPVSVPPRRESLPLVVPHRRESPTREQPTPTVVAPPPGRLAAFLRKFSSKGDSKHKSGSEHGSSRGSSRSNSPDIRTRHSTPLSSLLPPAPVDAQRHVSFPPPPPSAHQLPACQVRTSVESEPETATPVERKIGSDVSMFAPSPRSVLSSASADSSDKRMQLLATLRTLLEDVEKHELSDIGMVRISILLSTVDQIVREDLSKERPPQGIMRRLSMLVPTPNNDAASKAPAPWVRSNQAMEEYERGHTTTIADIEKQIDQRKQSPSPPRAPSPQLTLLPVDGTITENAMTAFTEFETAQNLSEILHAFDRLLLECGVGETDARTPGRVYHHVKSGLYTQFAFRQKQLFRLLDAKLATDVYKRQPCLQKRVCVVGCGPVGLRAAVELALLGAQVVVIDKRKLFNRENILHMWPWVVQDLTSLGAKVFFPQFCHSSAYFHVGTRQLQCILLKVALLLGVKVYPGTSLEGLAAPDSIVSDRKSYYTVVTKPQIPWMEFTAVLGACGNKDKLGTHAGIKRFVFSRKEAIGLVCYFPNLGTNEEKTVNEFSWTIQFKQRMFAKMREIGIDLENVVYYRGEYHYLVMTPKRSNLLAQGVLKINYPIVSDLVAVENIDAGALNDYVARIINFFEIPQKSEFARVRLFDFSSRTRAAQAANVLTSRGKKLYVGLIGDALMEPFWPEGLGTCRGFLSAMDACWMVAQIGKQSDEQILADRELGYRIMQHISGFQRDDLQKNVRKYNADPTSRYTVQYPAAITY